MRILFNRKSNEASYEKKEIYMMTKSPQIQKMSDLADRNETITVNGYIIYEDDKQDGITTRILSIEIHTGEIFATNSPTFIDSFTDLVAMMEELPLNIVVLRKKSKNGSRTYILADLA